MVVEYIVIAILLIVVLVVAISNSIKDIKIEKLTVESNSLLDYIDVLKTELEKSKVVSEDSVEPKKKTTRSKKVY